MSKEFGWIGVDLDGTLAEYHGWQGEEHIGEPIKGMADRVKKWLAEGTEVRIFTARVCGSDSRRARRIIQAWTIKHFGVRLKVTNQKDYAMIEAWDDRAVRVVKNKGCPCCKQHATTRDHEV